MPAPSNRLPRPGKPGSDSSLALGSEYCVVGEMLCVVRIWTDAEWVALPRERRPVAYEAIAALGWVGAVPARRKQ